MDAAELILVTGATGNTGAAVLRQLEDRGVRVRALARRAPDQRVTSQSTEWVVGNFDDPISIKHALADVTRAYLVTPSSPEAEGQQVRFVEAAVAAGVKHVVKLSQFAADDTSPVRFLRYHAAVEKRIQALGIGYTFLRPNLYFQGLLAFQSMIAATGQFMAPIGSARVSAVDVRDIATVAAAALTGRNHEGKAYTITGPAAITHAEMADAIGLAIGRPVAFVDVSPEAFASALRQAGLPPWQVDGLIEDYAHYSRGEAATVVPTIREVTGTEARDVLTFAHDHAEAFTGEMHRR